jgi:hypothetical protein
LKNDLFPQPPTGEHKAIDILAKVKLKKPVRDKQKALVALVLLEIEGKDSVSVFERRLFDYWYALEKEYQTPVLPTVIFMHKALNGIDVGNSSRTFGSLTINSFNYLRVGLRGLDALDALKTDNWLKIALTGLMNVPKDQAAKVCADSLKKLNRAPLSKLDKYYLGECVEAYSQLDPDQEIEYTNLIETKTYSEISGMRRTTGDIAFEEGEKKGEINERRKKVRAILEDRFGKLAKKNMAKIDSMNANQLEKAFMKSLRAVSLKEIGLE